MEPIIVSTTPYPDQKPGTSGLRKPTRTFTEKENYTENFIASILAIVDQPDSCLVVGGDGRYFMKESIQLIIQQAAACEKITKLVVGQNGILSTPAASNLIIKNKAFGGILLTASHNPGGPDADFGMKFNCANGGPAPSNVTDAIFEISKKLDSFKICKSAVVDLSVVGTTKFESLEVEIVDPVKEYKLMCERIFDFPAIKKMFDNGFKVRLDCMHAVTGPYATEIMKSLNASEDSVCNNIPHESFNNVHPDPNLVYAKELVDFMKNEENKDFELGVAFDGDGDRNMILGGKGFFVNPSDSLALIAEHANNCIPYFQANGGVKGIARSMPTSASCDKVAKDLGVECYQTPTGWKYFGALMDSGKISLCGEESFGTGSDHIREKDGLWACLAWLNILAKQNGKMNVQDLVESHWRTYGRHYYSRWDYEGLTSEQGKEIMQNLEKMAEEKYSTKISELYLNLSSIESFEYTDLDGSVASRQGIIMKFESEGIYLGRAVVRLSGTGSSGATLRLYLERFDEHVLDMETQEAVSLLQKGADLVGRITEISKREAPTVIT